MILLAVAEWPPDPTTGRTTYVFALVMIFAPLLISAALMLRWAAQ